MTPAARITLWAVGYSFSLALFIAFGARGNSTGLLLASGLLLGAGLLVGMFAALADLRLAVRLPIALCLAALAAIPVALIGLDSNQLLGFAATYSLTVGLLAPLRIYGGTIGQPRASQPRRPSVAALLGLTLYFAFVALLFSTGDAPMTGIVAAMPMAAAIASPVMVFLSTSRKLRIIGVVLGLVVLVSSMPLALSAGRMLWAALSLLAETYLTPVAAVFVLRVYGYRLRR